MLVYILKFSACLAIFMVFYKLVLEKENMHTFKRFYLLAAIGLAIGIPLITFIEYIEPLNTLGTFQPLFIEPVFSTETEQVQDVSINYLPYALWSIYGLGVLFFGIKFALNLNRIHYKIKHNPKHKIQSFTNVLLKDLISPHTFFNYIFLNRFKFESNEIPNEVFIHEQAHATQKHSIDILIIELLQIVFWFNPLIYFIKSSIKLNHEFLADKAVLNNGISTSTYQEILLAFSSNSQEYQLANAINYSSIKKRFTVMKTQTSKTTMWLRSLILLPLLALLIYSFSSTKKVEKSIFSKTLATNHTARSISIKVFNNGTYEVDDIKATKKTFVSVINQLHQDITPEIRNKIINIHVSSETDILDKEVWFIYNSVIDYGFHRIVTNNQEIIREKGNKPFAITNADYQQKATSKQIKEYNAIVKKLNSQPENRRIIKQKDVARIKHIYSLMTAEQKKEAETFPKLVPPPPAPVAPKVNDVKNIPTPQTPQNNKNKSGPNSPSNFIQKPKDSITIIFSNFSETQQKEKKVQSTMSEDQKKQLAYRKLILRASKLLDHKPTYKIEGQPASIDDVYTFINDYPQSSVKTIKNSNENLTLSFTNSNGKKMSYNELQAVYTKVFDMTNEPELIMEVTLAPIPENATPEERARIIKANQAYTKTKAGKIIKIVETPMDDEGIAKINGKTYYYKIKDGETTFYNKFGDVVDIKNINSFSLLKNTTNQEKEWSKVKRFLHEHLNKNIIKINGKTPINNEITLTRKEVENLELTLKNESILSFKFKVMGTASQHISGNTLNEKGKFILQMVLNIENVQIFDIKTSDGKKHPPILITIKD